MKKFIIGITLVGVIALAAFSAVGVAQAETEEPPVTRGGGHGGGPRGPLAGDGVLHEYIIANLAAELGISVEELESRLAGGESFMEIALSLGYDFETAREMMADARAAAIEQALADGVITEEEAEFYRSRGTGGSGGGKGSGSGAGGGRGSRGGGYGGDCPFDDTSGE